MPDVLSIQCSMSQLSYTFLCLSTFSCRPATITCFSQLFFVPSSWCSTSSSSRCRCSSPTGRNSRVTWLSASCSVRDKKKHELNSLSGLHMVSRIYKRLPEYYVLENQIGNVSEVYWMLWAARPFFYQYFSMCKDAHYHIQITHIVTDPESTFGYHKT